MVRTAWLYGAGGPNFVRTMIALERTKETVDVVDDQRGQPTWTVDLAAHLVRLGRAAAAGAAPAGIYHGTSSGEATWFDLARETFRLVGADPDRVRPTTSAHTSVRRPARRSAFSATNGGVTWASSRSGTGEPRSPRRSRRSSPPREPLAVRGPPNPLAKARGRIIVASFAIDIAVTRSVTS